MTAWCWNQGVTALPQLVAPWLEKYGKTTNKISKELGAFSHLKFLAYFPQFVFVCICISKTLMYAPLKPKLIP